MWHKLLLALLFVLALAAEKLVLSDLSADITPAPAFSLFVDQTSTSVASDDIQDSFSVPNLYRLNASIFSTENQTSPNYVLEIEFFEVKLAAGLYKHLANPPSTVHWFELNSFTPQSSRLSGWKDGNYLYVSQDISLS